MVDNRRDRGMDAETDGADPRRRLYLDAIADADPYPYWYDDTDAPDSNPTLVRTESCDLCVIGGGYTGLWTAIIAKERDPSRDVVMIDAHEIGSAASGRNGGFMDASLTHGVSNGKDRFPDELAVLEDLGLKNLNEIEAAIERYRIDCDYERTGVIDVATSLHPASYLDELRDDYALLRQLGQPVEFLDADGLQRQIHSPTYRGGLWRKDRAAIVDPARLCWGLKAAAESLGVRIYEDTKATDIRRDGVGVLVTTPLGQVRAGRVALATNAFPPLLRRLGHYIAPVYDYVLVSEPLTAAQMGAIGWAGRQGLSDIPNQFHYYRLTSDNRILWGGYDAVYYFRGKVRSELESRPETWAKLSQHFFTTFPQLEDVKFTHAWGGPLGMGRDWHPTIAFDRASGIGTARGYIGHGVSTTNLGGRVLADLITGTSSPLTELPLVNHRSRDWEIEPFRWLGVRYSQWAIGRVDEKAERTGVPPSGRSLAERIASH